MAQIVKPGRQRNLRVRFVGFLQYPLEVADGRTRLDGSSDSGREDKSALDPSGTGDQSLLKLARVMRAE